VKEIRWVSDIWTATFKKWAGPKLVKLGGKRLNQVGEPIYNEQRKRHAWVGGGRRRNGMQVEDGEGVKEGLLKRRTLCASYGSKGARLKGGGART